jgi:hypothetical protein
MADSAASTQSRRQRTASKQQRRPTVPTETENKLARAARSAQRLAQLSDASRDDSTLDLFPDDPTRATLESMNIDVRQGTLRGFELPDVVLAAVGAIDTDGAAAEARAARRAPRAAKSGEPAPVSAQLSGLEPQAAEATATATFAGELAFDDGKAAAPELVGDKLAASPARDAAAPLTPAMAAATVARSVAASRQAGEPRATSTDTAAASALDADEPSGPRKRLAAPSADAPNATNATTAPQTATAAQATIRAAERAFSSGSEPRTMAGGPAAEQGLAAAALRAAPELDRARATAFADTVDALYGVIADQRLAATDHSRRMKWMLSIVVGALLMTVAIGITQTVLLMHLTRETTTQQHRIEQMMQNQQAAMASLLDSHIALAHAMAASAAPDSAATATAATPAPAPPARSKRSARARHAAHKPKTASLH